jgi:hypothetical protein
MASIALRTSQPKDTLALLSTSQVRKRVLLRASSSRESHMCATVEVI